MQNIIEQNVFSIQGFFKRNPRTKTTCTTHLSCLFLPAHSWYDRFKCIPFRARITNPSALRKNLWCSSTFRTKNIHKYHVCLCQHILLRQIFLFEQELRTARVLRNHVWCSSTFRTKNIYHVCFYQHILATIDIPNEMHELRTARVLRKHFWCIFTFRTKNIHIYHVCFCQHILATMDVPNDMHKLRIERSVNTNSMVAENCH